MTTRDSELNPRGGHCSQTGAQEHTDDSRGTSALLCALFAMADLHPCFAPDSAELSPSMEAERRMSALNEEAILLNPETTDVLAAGARRWVQTNLDWLLATCPDGAVRDGTRAVSLAEQVVARTPKELACLDTLAASHAGAGRFEEAVKTQQQALAPMKKGNPLFAEYREHLRSYKAGEPQRDDGSNP